MDGRVVTGPCSGHVLGEGVVKTRLVTLTWDLLDAGIEETLGNLKAPPPPIPACD